MTTDTSRCHFEIYDLDTDELLASYGYEQPALSAYGVACDTDSDWVRRLAVYRVDNFTGQFTKIRDADWCPCVDGGICP